MAYDPDAEAEAEVSMPCEHRPCLARRNSCDGPGTNLVAGSRELRLGCALFAQYVRLFRN